MKEVFILILLCFLLLSMIFILHEENLTSNYGLGGTSNKEHYSRRLCSMKDLVPGNWTLGKEKDYPPYIPMKGEAQQKTCIGFDPNAKWQEWEWVPSADCEFSSCDFDEDLCCSLSTIKTIAVEIQ